jgi:hypothetical protein
VNRQWLLGAAATLVVALGADGITPGAGHARHPHPPPGGGHGNVVASVPGASIAPGDHVTDKVQPGRTYRTVFSVWVASNARKARVRVRAEGGAVSDCSSRHPRSGAVTYVTCEVRPKAKRVGPKDVTVTVVVRTSNLGSFSRTFRHEIAAAS